MNSSNMKRWSMAARARDRGVSLIFALLALAAMSLAAVALVRSVQGGTLLVGNVGFKQDTTRAANRAAEAARAYLTGGGNDLSINGAAGSGYYATAHTNIDPTGRRASVSNPMELIAWEGTTCNCPTSTCTACLRPSNEFTVNGGNVRAQYLITRLCPATGAIDDFANACAQPAALDIDNCYGNGGHSHGDLVACLAAQQALYYRVIVRTVGGRNTVSYTETIVH
jgi:type IV pilus assembly protein PilX